VISSGDNEDDAHPRPVVMEPLLTTGEKYRGRMGGSCRR
jgi:hypothetical protein